jgi:hypothetical protein
VNIRQILNRNRIRRLLQSRTKLHDVVRKVAWLEFENENILNYLTKYNILRNGQQNTYNTSKNKIVQEDTNIKSSA